MADDRWLTLTPQYSDGTPHLHMAYRLVVTATAHENVDPAIFVYLQLPPEAEAAQSARFDHIASPSDLEDIPVGAPLPDATERFFRLDSVDLVLRSADERAEVWDDIVADARLLVQALENIDVVVADTPTTIAFGE